MKETRKITEGALMTGIYLLLLLVIIFIPAIISVLFMFILPVPFVVYSYRYGFKSGTIVLIASTLVSVIIGLAFALPTTLLMGLGGLFIGGTMHKKRSPYETLAMGSVGFMIGFAAVFLISQAFFGVNFTEQFNQIMDQSISRAEGMLGTFGGSDAEDRLDQFKEQLQRLPDLIPSMLAMLGVTFSFISQWLSYKLLNRVEKTKLQFPPFRELNLPSSLLWYYLAALVFELFIKNQEGMLYLASVNVYTITAFFLVLQGFSFIFHFAYQKKMSKAIPIIILIVTILIPTILMELVRLLGIIDLGFSLRKRVQGKK